MCSTGLDSQKYVKLSYNGAGIGPLLLDSQKYVKLSYNGVGIGPVLLVSPRLRSAYLLMACGWNLTAADL